MSKQTLSQQTTSKQTTSQQKVFVATTLLSLALVACGSTPPLKSGSAASAISETQRLPCAQLALTGQFLPECPVDPGNPPPTPHPTGLQIHDFDELQAKARRLGVSLDEAASPYIERYLARPAPISTQSYPTNATGTQDFINKLYAGRPPVLTGPLPDPTPAGNPACADIAHDVTSPGSDGLLSFTDHPGTLYVGALYQGNSAPAGVGSLSDLPIDATKRNLLTLYTDTPGVAPQTGIQPNPAEVYNATGTLISGAVSRWGADQPNEVYLKVLTASSVREAALQLKLDVSAFGGSVSAHLDSSSNTENNSVYVVFKQTLFNVLVNDVGSYSAFQKLFNTNLVLPDLNDLGNRNLLGYENLPTFIRSVSYGRALIVRYSSSKDVTELKAALEAKFGKNSGGVSEYQKRILDSSDFEVLAYGGPYEITKEAFKQDGWKTYLEKTNVPLSTLKPVGYGLSFWDGRHAQISNVFRYLEHTCRSQPAKVEVKIENRRGDTVLYLKDASGLEREIVRLDQDGAERVFDLTPFLDGQDDNIRVFSSINKYGFFGSSERDTKVTFFVDGLPFNGSPAAPAEAKCKQCHSGDVANYTVNKKNGKLERR